MDKPLTNQATSHVSTWPLLNTRIRPPLMRGQLVERPRLLALLEASRESLLTILRAPAGYGKTTLLCQWYELLRQQEQPVAWVALDEMDHETGRILSYLIAAIEKTHAQTGQSIAGHFEVGSGLRAEAAVPVIVNEIEKLDRDFFIILEDLHLATSQSALAMFDALFRASGEKIHFICSCREVPDLSLGRLRMQRSLVEINAADLQFAMDEASQFFQHFGDVSIDQDSISSITRKTDGWVAGLQLAAISLKGRENQDEFIQSFTGTNVNVRELLTSEVLDRQDVDIQQFLMDT